MEVDEVIEHQTPLDGAALVPLLPSLVLPLVSQAIRGQERRSRSSAPPPLEGGGRGGGEG